MRKFVERNVAFPVVRRQIATKRETAIARGPNRHQSRAVVSDVPGRVRVYEVLRRPRISAQRCCELLPVGRRVDIDKRKLPTSRLSRDPTQGAALSWLIHN